MRKKIISILLGVTLFSTVAESGTHDETCVECVKLDGGVAKGKLENGILSLKGIAYAEPPVGELRFRPPSPPSRWKGVLDATSFRTVCPQIADPIERYPETAKAQEILVEGVATRVYEDEDCLYLNVWRPANQDRDLPIMVYLPGGGFIVGGASDIYDGAALARKGVVVVTINYRIGFLGFGELGAIDSEYRGSGNNGLRDQLAAVEWVRRNALALGADPQNITIFGESAGSISIAALLTAPSLDLPFQKAILQSGGYNLVRNKKSADAAARKIIESGDLKTIGDLKTASVRDLLLQIAAVGEPDGLFAPVADGSLVALDPARAFATGRSRNIPILLGTNANEMNYWSMYDSKFRNPFVEDSDLGPRIDVFSKLLNGNALGESATEDPKRTLSEAYAKILQASDKKTIETMLVDDVVMTQAATHLAERQKSAGGAAWLYRFDWRVPSEYLDPDMPDLGAFHAIELPFVFGTGDFSWIPGGQDMAEAQLPEVDRLTGQMLSAWTNFAKRGNPNGEGVPDWPSYDLEGRFAMVWSADSKAIADPDGPRRKLWADWHFTPY